MIDWNALGTIISLLAVGLTIIALILEMRHSRIALQTDALLRFSERFESERFRAIRRIAAYYLLNIETKTDHNYALDEILEFLSEMAFLKKKKAIDDELLFNQFSWWIIRYWLCAQDHIEKVRQQDPLSWFTLEKLATELQLRERKEGYSDKDYTDVMLQKFMQDEFKLINIDRGTVQFLNQYFGL